ncbi:transcriptional regulator, Rrf2 family [Deferribacter desulfuricans SSM1]|uniref:Transcriptional regulator, Rrf2 family n=1 Tax=Deferribacter desulfuricans (strain DSM 14783 / JCM 11476 / NBRC 101012 / SSM1) TaxID=639282 RepID=D3PA74_DEFDS|nr:Rrf2 family transcriptional regulator [Deferribacter desulfuricans]BAI81614.1 transcriptional regulator, Rrf2 family [Deferribacter desulfuricans SSM1]
MKVTTRSRYAIRALYALALAGGDKTPVSLKKVSEMESISMKYLERLFSNLMKAGIVNSVRGIYGGYIFSKPLNEITLLDVVEVMDGVIKPVDCVEEEGCDRSRDCSINWIWFDLKNIIENYLSKITFYDLVYGLKNKYKVEE